MTRKPDLTPAQRRDLRNERRATRKINRNAARKIVRRADLAVAYLFVRRLWPTLPLILIALPLVQTGFFAIALQIARPVSDSHDFMISFDLLCERAGLGWLFAAAFIALTVALAALPHYGPTKTVYTLSRLGINDRRIAVHHLLCALSAYLSLWAIELITVMAFSMIYQNTVAPLVPTEPLTQSLYLATVSDPFLHSILPLRDITRWIADGMTVITLALAVSNISVCRRYHFKPWISTIAIPTLAILFVREPDRWDMDLLFVIPLCLLFSILILRVWKKGVDLREKDPS